MVDRLCFSQREVVDMIGEFQLPPEGARIAMHATDTPSVKGVICSLATGTHRLLLAESAPTLMAYGKKHGWDVVISSETLTSRPPSWAKISLVRELLSAYPMALWVDADALFVDLDRDIVEECSANEDIWFARHPQNYDPNSTVLNAGIILARSSSFTESLFEAVWNAEAFIDHNWWENAALLDLLGYSLEPPYAKLRQTEWDSRIGTLDLAWNSVPGYCESDNPAINHHARSDHDSFDRRIAGMRSDGLRTMAMWSTSTSH
jgi:galactosyl transferase GMA12/MNN10 family